jgi:Na+/H+ antiporter NhaD/arsenite permease-like protein
MDRRIVYLARMPSMRAVLRRHALTAGAGIAAALLLATGRVSARVAARAIDLDLLLVLFALLVAVELLRAAGWLDLAVAAAVARFRRTRSFALALIALSGALASLVTNDVALFVVIPFTVAASRVSDFDLEDAVILEIVAANLIGCLTPLGNPQNLFVFHRSGWSAAQFIATMLPFVAAGTAGLLAAAFLLGPSRPLVKSVATLPRRDVAGGVAGALCFVLVLLEIGRVMSAWPAAIAALLCALFFLGRRALDVDYSVVPLFLFAFVIVEGLRGFEVYRLTPRSLYWSSIGLSQVISNVPATVLLSPLAHARWRELLYGANAGGCGTIIASLANLLGWRIYQRESGREPRFFARLTALNFAFLVWIAAAGWLLLRQ